MDIQIDENTTKEEINKMIDEFEKLTGETLEDNNRRNRQSREIDIGEDVTEEVEFRFKYPPNCS